MFTFKDMSWAVSFNANFGFTVSESAQEYRVLRVAEPNDRFNQQPKSCAVAES